MRDASGARFCEPPDVFAGTMPLRVERTRPRVRWLAPRQPQPFKVKLADQRDAPSPSQAEGAMPSGAILPKAGAILLQPDCNSRRGIAPNCTRLHQIAPDCGHCAIKSKGRKPGRKNGILLLSFCLHLVACEVAEASRLLVVEAPRRHAAATFPGSLMPLPHRLSGTLNLVGFNLRQSKLIQLNPG